MFGQCLGHISATFGTLSWLPMGHFMVTYVGVSRYWNTSIRGYLNIGVSLYRSLYTWLPQYRRTTLQKYLIIGIPQNSCPLAVP